MKNKTIKDVVNSGLCISCGACAAMSPEKIAFTERHGMLLPKVNSKNNDRLIRYCPGGGYEIVKLGRELYGDATNHDIELGHYRIFCAARSLDKEIAVNASSGGVITAILLYLLETNRIQGAVVTKFTYGSSGPKTLTYIATNKKELLESQGSKYCPVVALESLHAVRTFPGKVAWVGTPCQIAGLRMIQADDRELKEKIAFTVANFCGGFRDFREARRLAELCRVRFEDINMFRYRGDGQPGFMRIETRQGEKHMLPYPDYARLTGYTKLQRCRLCVDAMGELADFNCGDAWIPRFISTKIPWSIVMTRSTAATDIFQKMRDANILETAEITLAELKKSQYDNLRSKKTRQHARRKIYAMLGIDMPVYDGGYENTRGGLLLELRIHFTYVVFGFMEKIKLYKFLDKAIHKYRGR